MQFYLKLGGLFNVQTLPEIFNFFLFFFLVIRPKCLSPRGSDILPCVPLQNIIGWSFKSNRKTSILFQSLWFHSLWTSRLSFKSLTWASSSIGNQLQVSRGNTLSNSFIISYHVLSILFTTGNRAIIVFR